MPEAKNLNLEKSKTKISTPLVKRQPGIGRLFTVVSFLFLFGLYGFQLWYQATRTSVTNDEPFHIVAGYRYWQCGDYGINPEHPPLLKLLAASPLMLQTFIEPTVPCGSKITPKLEGFYTGALFLSRNGVDRILIPARLAASLMSLLLAALVFLAVREMFGKPEAFVALALLVFEPNLIAHGALVTTDMALTATMFGAVYALYRYCKKRRPLRLLVAGLAIGAMLASKHSGILMLPVLFLLLIGDLRLARRNRTESGLRLSHSILNRTSAYTAIVLISLIALWATYDFRYYALPNADGDTVSVVDLFKTSSQPEVAETRLGKTVEIIRRARILPESYVYGLADIVAWGEHKPLLLGKIYPNGQWFYFPMAFTIKTSVVLLLLLPLGLLTIPLYRRHPREMLFLLLPSLAFFAISLTWSLNIGVRHILPVYPFFISVAAAGAGALARKYRFFFYILIAVLLFHAFTAWRTAPSYIAFGNDFWGGTNNTFKLLDNSNVDWGQNLKIIEQYLEKENIHDCWLASPGMGELVRSYQSCHLMPAPGWTATEQIIEPLPPVIEGTIFLSSIVLPPNSTVFETIAKTEPVTILGGSILVYRGRYEIPLASALSYIGRGNQYIRFKRFDEAISDGRKAVELAPDDPRTHLYMGTALAAAGENDEARREFEQTLSSVQSNPDLYSYEQQQAFHWLSNLR
jgi:hypothetical protein